MNGKPSSQKAETLGRYDRVRSTGPTSRMPAIIVTVMNHFCRGIQKGLKNDGITPGGFTGIVDRGWVVPRYVESLLFIKNHPSDTVDGSKIRDQLTS